MGWQSGVHFLEFDFIGRGTGGRHFCSSQIFNIIILSNMKYGKALCNYPGAYSSSGSLTWQGDCC